MHEYQKIQGLFKRDEETNKFIEGDWSLPEFEYLQNNNWIWTEKIDGINIRVMQEGDKGSGANNPSRIAGKTDKTLLPMDLVEYLQKRFTSDMFRTVFEHDVDVCLYGEGYGAGIQKGGAYRSDKGFILFDIKVGRWWLKRDDLTEIARTFEIPIVPVRGYGKISEAITVVKKYLPSCFGEFEFEAEGLVLQPEVCLFARNGQRIITKVKHVDFES